MLRFIALYQNVFDEHNQIKSCGRDACKDLIQAALLLEPQGGWGDPETGMLNVEALQRLYTRLVETTGGEKDNVVIS